MKMTAPEKLLHRFRMVGIAEGISFLVLLLIAMPIKYLLKIPEPVKLVGWLHGALFITYLYFIIEVAITFKKSLGWCIISFLAAFVPCGTFITDKKLRKEEKILQRS